MRGWRSSRGLWTELQLFQLLSAALGVRPGRLLPPGLWGRALRGPRLGRQSRREGACRPELGVGFKIRVDWGTVGIL